MSQTSLLVFYTVSVCLDSPMFTLFLAPHALLHFRPSFLPSGITALLKEIQLLEIPLVMSVHSKLYFLIL